LEQSGDERNMLVVANYDGHDPMHFSYDAMGNLVKTIEEMELPSLHLTHGTG
jgi:hypothetical protein